jgi:mono/diheme cytochrome c family protein
MKRRLLLLALLSSCGPLASEVVEPLTVADAGSPPLDAGVDAGVAIAPDAGQPEPTGLPCDVRAVLETHCTGCHGGQTYVPHLLARADFLQPRLGSPQRVGEYALERMLPNAAAPMPPYGYQTQPTAPEVAVISAWVNAGMPGGACGEAVAH